PFHVSITHQLILADYTIRTLSVEFSGKTRKVTHFHYTAWPDHGVPDYATSMLNFHKVVLRDHKAQRGPLLVHCSAGVGRTGTFIAIDHVLEQRETEGVVDIPGVILKLRQQRTKMVQTLDQYIFIHDAILESVTCGDTEIKAADLRRKLVKLKRKDDSGLSGLDLQFAILDQVSGNVGDAQSVAARNDPTKNRSTDFLPVDKWRVVLKGENPDYIHATNIRGYKQQRAFIITQGPMRSTARDFWKMVYRRKCSVVVMLSDLVEQNEEVCYQYWPEKRTQSYGEFSVELLNEERKRGFLLRTLSVQEAKSGTAHQVWQFHIPEWSSDYQWRGDVNAMVSVIEEVSKVQRKTGNHPIVVHGLNTVSRSAIFCGVATTIERCKTEGVVDVFQVVKAMRVQKPGAIQTLRPWKVAMPCTSTAEAHAGKSRPWGVDFWRMVWQERVPSVVMITNLVEGKKTKCEQYWPSSGSQDFGPFHVSITHQLILADNTIRTLSVELSGKTRKVTHFHYTAWPDHGVPDYATSMLNFHKMVMKDHKAHRGPLLVHCSAGVGRTGTFIAIDNVLEQRETEGVVNIPGVILKLRQQRTNTVQTLDQYIFIHDAILESVTCGDTEIEAGDLRKRLVQLKNQRRILDQVSSNVGEAKSFAAQNNLAKNRSTDFLPVDNWRVVLKGENPDYIHASSVHGYKKHRAFIITQGPMRSTARDFWKMVYSRKCSVVVMLSDLIELDEEVCYQYWPGKRAQTYGEFRVELLSEGWKSGFLFRNFSVQQAKFATAHQVWQFHIPEWSSDYQWRGDVNAMVSVIEEVSKVQRKTGNHPIVVHGLDTVSRSAIFCGVATTIERCKTEGVVGVFQVVKAMRAQKPGAIQTLEQYQSIYEALLVFIDSFETYSNFTT
ncbi:Receptor-type tyrosine-protein phosphatase alpha, partial [Geodia barretti]